MTPEERQTALQLVDEIQKDRSGAKLSLTPDEVPHILLPYQVRWHQDESIVRFCDKGRRVGFTWGAWAAEAALEAALDQGGMDQFYMGYNQGMAAEFIGDCATFARWYNQICSEIDVGLESVVIGDEKRDIVTYKIKFASGNKIEALSAMPHNWRGRQGHARIDEAGHQLRLEAVIDGALAYETWGGRISIGGTHNGEENPFNDYAKRCREGKLPWSYHQVKFSDAILEGLHRRICLVTGKKWSPEAQAKFTANARAKYASSDTADEELECIPRRGSGAYFSRILIEHHGARVPVARFRVDGEFVTDPGRLAKTALWIHTTLKPLVEALPKDRRTVLGQDFGRSGDLSVCTPMQERAIGRGWDVPFRVELRNVPFDCQKMIVLWLMRHLPLLHQAKFDARGNGQSHAEAALQAFGASRVECVMATGAWYDEHFPKYHQAFEDGEITGCLDEDYIADHRAVVLVDGKPRMSDARITGSDGGDRHGDAAIAGVLAWAAARAEAQPPAGESIEARPGDYRASRPGRGSHRGLFGLGADRLSGSSRRLWGQPAPTTPGAGSDPLRENSGKENEPV